VLARHGWPRSLLFSHGGNQVSLAIAGGFGLGARNPIVFGAFGGFADDARMENGSITLSDRPGIGFEGQAALPHHAGTGRHLEKRLG
jgi:D(-)-tartrate dehydratase